MKSVSQPHNNRKSPLSSVHQRGAELLLVRRQTGDGNWAEEWRATAEERMWSQSSLHIVLCAEKLLSCSASLHHNLRPPSVHLHLCRNPHPHCTSLRRQLENLHFCVNWSYTTNQHVLCCKQQLRKCCCSHRDHIMTLEEDKENYTLFITSKVNSISSPVGLKPLRSYFLHLFPCKTCLCSRQSRKQETEKCVRWLQLVFCT